MATWTIEDGLLYLVKLDSWLCRAWKKSTCKMVDLQRLFGNRYRDGKVRADWFSGELKMPDGKLLQWVHMGHGSVYEREITLHVESGKVMSASTFDNTQRTLPPGRELERRQLEKLKPKPPLKR